MIIVSDTTPIITFVKADSLILLKELFGTVVIPKAVYEELTSNLLYQDEINVINNCEFLEVKEVRDKTPLMVGNSCLHSGEREAILLAKDLNALLLIDEIKARKYAIQEGISITGSIGILKKVYKDKIRTKQDIDNIVNALKQSDIYIAKHLYDYIFED